MNRHSARLCAVQALYAMDIGKDDHIASVVSHVLSEQSNVTEQDANYVMSLVTGTQEHLEDIDAILRTHVEGWTLDRIARVELSVLRLACYELQHAHDVDVPVIVDEAVEIAKAFSNEPAAKFVNGVLAKVSPVIVKHRP